MPSNVVVEKTPESPSDVAQEGQLFQGHSAFEDQIIHILREINPEYLLEGLMLKLKFQYFGHLIQTANSL